jgi:hypothetical protein
MEPVLCSSYHPQLCAVELLGDQNVQLTKKVLSSSSYLRKTCLCLLSN